MAGPITEGIQLGLGISKFSENRRQFNVNADFTQEQLDLNKQQLELENQREQGLERQRRFTKNMNIINSGLHKNSPGGAEAFSRAQFDVLKDLGVEGVTLPALIEANQNNPDFMDKFVSISKSLDKAQEGKTQEEKDDLTEFAIQRVDALYIDAKTPGQIRALDERKKQLEGQQAEFESQDKAKTLANSLIQGRLSEDPKIRALSEAVLSDPRANAAIRNGDGAALDALIAEKQGAVGGGKSGLTSGLTSKQTLFLPDPDKKGNFIVSQLDPKTGEVSQSVRDGKQISLSEDQVLTAVGKKTRSVINEFKRFVGKELGRGLGKEVQALKDRANIARSSKKIIESGLFLLDQGIFTGPTAKIETTFNKFLQRVGAEVDGVKVATTEAYSGLMAAQMGKILASGIFGTSVSITDSDRDVASGMAAGDIKLSEESLRKLLDINRRLADTEIFLANEAIGRAEKAFLENNPFERIPTEDVLPEIIDQRKEIIPPTGNTQTDQELMDILNAPIR